MSSDKKKGGVAKAQASSSKSKDILKQKTLFDSFVVKSNRSVKTDAIQIGSAPGPLSTEALSDATLLSSNNSAAPPCVNDTATPTLGENISDVELTARPVQILDLSTPDMEIKKSGTLTQDVDEKRRSPSILILDDDEIPPPMTQNSSSQTKKSKVTLEGHTRDQPIVIPSSPIKKPSAKPGNHAPVHPFFTYRAKPTSSSVPLSAKKPKTAVADRGPPYPNSKSQHVKGPQTLAQTYEPSFPKKPTKQFKQVTSEGMDYKFLARCPDIVEDEHNETWIHPIAATPNEPSILDVPPEHISNHPAIARFMGDGPDNLPTSSRPWAERWRPSCAKEVLGNETSAIYLRNWLRALELQLEGDSNNALNPAERDASFPMSVKSNFKPSQNRGTKRARVVRTVEKRRKKSRLDSDEEDDNWIVNTDESEEEVNYEEMDEFGEVILPEVPARSSPSSSTHDLPLSSIENTEHDLGQLHNTILLSGPSGSGKTASVYACSEELGWDVFEVYPGVGRRNGAHIDNLVGEVGKNHLVLQNRRNRDILKNFLSQKESHGGDAPSRDSLVKSYSPRKKRTALTGDAIDIEEPNNDAKPIRQSLILLEEVDILYKEDINFWTTVIRIIKECKRPVICTCNDISLVPIQDLPLQSILHFEPCPTNAASSYLQALCLAEGYSVDRDLITRLYSYPLEGNQAKLFSSSYPPATPDLRRTLNALQIKCAALAKPTPGIIAPSYNPAGPPEAGAAEAQPFARRVIEHEAVPFSKKSEFLSFLDGELVRDPSGIFTTEELASYLPSGDDEIGHTILYDEHAADRHQLGHHDRHEDVICSAVEIWRRLFDMDVMEDDRSREESRKRRREEQLMVLREVKPARLWTGGLALEYVPYVRQMVCAEDMEETRALEKRGGRGRQTRNSGRSEYVRTILISEEVRRIVGTSGLSIVEGA